MSIEKDIFVRGLGDAGDRGEKYITVEVLPLVP